MSNSPTSSSIGKPKPMNLIAAVDAKFAIGKNNDLPWRLPKEYAHFVRETKRTSDPQRINAVIMGRRCWESIPAKFRPLRDRISVVLSRTLPPMIDTEQNIVMVRELDEALDILTRNPAFADKLETIWNAGGAEIYRMGLTHPWTHKLILTRIEAEFDADVFFPPIPWDDYEENEDFKPLERVEEKGVQWYVTSFTRKNTMFF
ncbi:Dihydrofolate reductase [Aphelenchoides besseyi]|nr:Dihydrofolate reductase [Aphelenchoides besseyi]KAI6220159.1 Dihydrofolate reductase [Aphelenchoides besseyi]